MELPDLKPFIQPIQCDELEMKHIAKERNLLISGGSDYHGANKPDIELGTGRGHLFVPEEILTKIKEYKNNI